MARSTDAIPHFDVKAWLGRMGLNLTEAADLIDCSRRSMSRWANTGTKPDPYSVRQMQRLEQLKDEGKPFREGKPTTWRRRGRKLLPPPRERNDELYW